MGVGLGVGVGVGVGCGARVEVGVGVGVGTDPFRQPCTHGKGLQARGNAGAVGCPPT